jgi:hypothetical protein
VKAKFINENQINLIPENEDERILFNRFAKLLASNQKRLSPSFTYSMGGENRGVYTALGLCLLANLGKGKDE